MRFRKLRIAFSITCLIACVLLVALWLTSLYFGGYIRLISFGEHFHIAINPNWSGRIAFFNDSEYGPYSGSIIGFEGEQIYERGFGDMLGIYYRYFRWPSITVLWTLQSSIWYPVLAFSTLAALPWIHLSKRFSLRTLLIATTLIAAVLGLIDAVLRWPAG